MTTKRGTETNKSEAKSLHQSQSKLRTYSSLADCPLTEFGPDDVPDLTPDPPCQRPRGTTRQSDAEDRT
jgi:hypothetical protein